MTVAARSLRRPVRAAAPIKALEGIVTGIVAVTGHEDSVQDIIIPGAFADTLKRRRPKLCWHHDWKDPLGRVLSIVEVKPGDKRLPKTLPDGRPWPKEAGALIATMQFNLRTARGREMFEHCVEWAKNGEAAFSIGYRVREGMASKRADGVRLIYGLDLFEVSLVLHGAHDMALALEVKDAFEHMEHKGVGGLALLEGKAAEPMIGNGAMVALYIDPEVASELAQADGNPAEELHVTLAFLGDASDIADPEGLAAKLRPAAATGPLSGQVGGIGVFPEGPNGTPVWVPVDVPGLTELRQSIVGALEAAGMPQRSEHGFTPHMTLGYDLPGIDPVPPTKVAFDTAYLVIGEQRIPLPLTAAAAPLEGKAHAAVTDALALAGALLEGKSAMAAVLEAKTMFGGSAGAVTVQSLGEPQKVSGATKRAKRRTPQEGIETKMLKRMRGSHEERREELQRALNDLLLRDQRNDHGEPIGWVCIDATFDDRVIATVEVERGSTTYQIDYSMAEDGTVTLGKPDRVELDVVALPAEDEEPEPVEPGEAVQMRYLDPASVMLTDATARINAMPVEGKAAWDEFSNSLLALMDALAVKGYDVAGAILGDEEDEPEPEPEQVSDEEEKPVELEEVQLEDDEDDEDEPEPDGDADDEVVPSKDTVTLDPEAVRAQLDELNA